MDLPVPDVQGHQNGDEPRVRSGSQVQPIDALAAAEKSFFNLAPVSEVEARYARLQQLLTELAVIARNRRSAREAERCAVCGGPWKHKLPDGGRVPAGTEFYERDDHTVIPLYACDAACWSKLQWEVNKRTYKLRIERGEQQIRDHQAVVESRKPQPRG